MLGNLRSPTFALNKKYDKVLSCRFFARITVANWLGSAPREKGKVHPKGAEHLSHTLEPVISKAETQEYP